MLFIIFKDEITTSLSYHSLNRISAKLAVRGHPVLKFLPKDMYGPHALLIRFDQIGICNRIARPVVDEVPGAPSTALHPVAPQVRPQFLLLSNSPRPILCFHVRPRFKIAGEMVRAVV